MKRKCKNFQSSVVSKAKQIWKYELFLLSLQKQIIIIWGMFIFNMKLITN